MHFLVIILKQSSVQLSRRKDANLHLSNRCTCFVNLSKSVEKAYFVFFISLNRIFVNIKVNTGHQFGVCFIFVRANKGRNVTRGQWDGSEYITTFLQAIKG